MISHNQSSLTLVIFWLFYTNNVPPAGFDEQVLHRICLPPILICVIFLLLVTWWTKRLAHAHTERKYIIIFHSKCTVTSFGTFSTFLAGLSNQRFPLDQLQHLPNFVSLGMMVCFARLDSLGCYCRQRRKTTGFAFPYEPVQLCHHRSFRSMASGSVYCINWKVAKRHPRQPFEFRRLGPTTGYWDSAVNRD